MIYIALKYLIYGICVYVIPILTIVSIVYTNTRMLKQP
jgi:hypothetical protein